MTDPAASLASIKAQLSSLLKDGCTFSSLAPVQGALDEVDAGRFKVGAPVDMTHVAEIDEAYDLLAQCLDAATDVDPALAPTLKQLQGIKKGLDRLAHAKHGHTHDDIRHYQNQLDAIDSKRTNGVFGDPAAPPAGQAQAVTALEDCFAAVASLQATATDMSGRVAVVHDALAKHVKHLQALVSAAEAAGGQPTTHDEFEVKKVQGHLQELDAERLGATPAGWGVAGGVVPPGQAVCADLLEEAFGLVRRFQELDEA